MKKRVLNFSKLFLILGLCCISIIGSSQDKDESKKEKKAASEAEKSKNYEELGTLIESKKFVFEADYIQYADKSRVLCSSVIKVDSMRVFIDSQNPIFSAPSRYSSVGDIQRFKLLKNTKEQSYTVKFYANDGGFSYDIDMVINTDKSGIVKMNMGNSILNRDFYGRIKAY